MTRTTRPGTTIGEGVESVSAGISEPIKKLRRQPERSEQQHIIKLLRTLGSAVYVLGTVRRKGDYMGTRQSPGLPDLFAFIPYEHGEKRRGAHLLAIEVKAPRGRMSPEQIEFQRQCQLADVHHIVGGLNEVIAWLIQTGRLMAEQVPYYRRPPA